MTNFLKQNEARKRTIAIIGGGFSGLMVAANLIQLAKQPLEIFLIEKTENLAKGVAYSTEDNSHLLNISAVKMGAFVHHTSEFYQWALANEQKWRQNNFFSLVPPLSPQAYLPRKLYALYLADILAQAQRQAKKKGIHFHSILNEVLAIEKLTNGQLSLTLKKGKKISCEKLVLAIGVPPVKQPNFLKKLSCNPFYLTNIWSEKALNQLFSLKKLLSSQHASILLLGTGLTTVDACMSLVTRCYKGTIVALSLSGRLPETHQEKIEKYPSLSLPMRKSFTILDLFKSIKHTITRVSLIGYDWRDVIDALRPLTSKIWSKLSFLERSKFFRFLLSFWNKHRHRMAPSCGEILARLQSQKQLKVLAGTVQSIIPQADQTFLVTYKNGDDLQRLTVEAILNCLGPELDIRQNDNPILKDLKNKGFIKFDKLNKGLAINKDYQVHGLMLGEIYGLGGLLFGEKLETTAVPELRHQAHHIAKHILKSFKKK